MKMLFSTEVVDVAQSQYVTLNVLREACIEFIGSLDAYDVRRLCWSGSLWVNLQDAITNDVQAESLHALGVATDQMTRQYGRQIGAVLVINFNGLADGFAVEDDDDDANDDHPRFAGPDQIMYSTEAGRQALLNCFGYAFEGDYDGLVVCLDEYLQDQGS